LVTERRVPVIEQRELRGWGGVAPTSASLQRIRDVDELRAALTRERPGGHGVIARGLGRSYGDAAQNGGGDVLDMTAMTGIRSVDAVAGTVTVEAGVTLGRLLATLAGCGLTLPVVPGTRFVTVGGAIASDIHGKNHAAHGSFAHQTVSLALYTPGGERVELAPERDGELFYATLGGMGLTGVVSEATLRVEPLAAPWLLSDVDRTSSLEHTLETMREHASAEHLIAWVDLLIAGPRFGRGLVHRIRAWPAELAHQAPREPRLWRPGHPAALARAAAFEVPRGFPRGVLRPALVRAYNRAHWAGTSRERGRPTTLMQAYFPLDVVDSWYRLYGPSGFYQYQFVVPPDAEEEMVRALELLHERRLPVYLAVIKRFGEPAPGPLSFPIAGWTAALDLPAGVPGLTQALDELDELVTRAGGRVYLTKDARLRPELLREMYPRLGEFDTVRARVDPGGVMRSDLGRRLGLCRDGR
jgi:decaprenylphospho-beta-D-ribofuranose 2-oxidase